MANDKYEDQNEEVLDEQVEGEEEEQQKAGTGWTGWLISFSFHAVLIFMLSMVYFLVKEPDTDTPPVRVATIDPPPKKEEKPKTDRQLETTVELDVEAQADKPSPITALDVPVETSEREEESDNPNPKGREEAVADSEMGGSGAFMAIGAGGGSSGMFGSRSGGGRKRAVGKYGGSRGSESAVDAALRWLKKHQSPNGMWDAEKYPSNCTEDPKCEPGHNRPGDTSVAMTGYATLCFLGAGYDHQTPNKFKPVVKKALDYLVSVQKADGLVGQRNYENAVATMALAEAYAMTGDPALKTPAQNAVNSVLAHQNQAGTALEAKQGYGNGLGWDYTDPNPRNDSSVTGWNVMALKSALAGQLNIGNGMEGAKHWLEKAWKATNPDWQKLTNVYTDESRFPYTYASDTEKVMIADKPAAGAPSSDEHDLTCVGAVCSVFLGKHSGDPMLETLCNYVMNHETPTSYPCNTYKMYYNTLAVFQVGGDRWQKWNSTVRDLLVNAQRKGDGCFDGSWNFEGTKFPGNDVGRVLSTVYCCLSLEVYYRYAQVAGQHK